MALTKEIALPQPFFIPHGASAITKAPGFDDLKSIFELGRGRPQHECGDLASMAARHRAPARTIPADAGKVYFQTVTLQDISATRIREAIARGEPVDGLMPPAVLEYLHAHRIYLNREN